MAPFPPVFFEKLFAILTSNSCEQAHDLVLESQGDYAVGVPCREAGLGRTELSNALTNFALASESEAGKGEGEGGSRKEAVRDLELALKLIQLEEGRADAVAEVTHQQPAFIKPSSACAHGRHQVSGRLRNCATAEQSVSEANVVPCRRRRRSGVRWSVSAAGPRPASSWTPQ